MVKISFAKLCMIDVIKHCYWKVSCDGSNGKTEDTGLKCPGIKPYPRQEKYFLLFWVGCFGTYEIHL